MMEKFRQLAPREQVIVVIGGALAVLIIGWSFVWSPLSQGAEELSQAVADKSRLVVDLRRAAGLEASNAPAARGPGQPTLYVLVDQTAQLYGLGSALTGTRPDGNILRVSFRDAPFDGLLGWLTELEEKRGVVAGSGASFTATGEPGLVTGQLVLQQ